MGARSITSLQFHVTLTASLKEETNNIASLINQMVVVRKVATFGTTSILIKFLSERQMRVRSVLSAREYISGQPLIYYVTLGSTKTPSNIRC